MTYAQTMTATLFRDVLSEIDRGRQLRKLYLIVDRHPTHEAGIVEAWLQGKHETPANDVLLAASGAARS